ncbi:pantoate--beta-alanine ligase isoform X2 [Euphorbia lathyris]|uniref:pantoate--beta-alanine ligase isoform X2 n=1 Tax=Euphorbia lathyris TaxID=212925 RepID=UPI00331317A9
MEARKRPEIITDKGQMRNWSRAMRSQGQTIALVPTMGYLHEGHLSLVKQAQNHGNLVVVSIYVNPGQFSPSEDLSTYPSDFNGDLCKLMSVPGGVDAVFNPHNLYDYENEDSGVSRENLKNLEGKKVVSCVEEKGMGHETWVRVERLENGMCGKSRPVFFRGVATIVTKLFNIVEPDFALFGKKDYQQWRIIQRMVRDLDFSIKIIASEIMRDSDGLAMSSRNVHLSAEEREKALSINKSLFKAKSCAEDGQVNCSVLRDVVIQAITEAGGKIDYAEGRDAKHTR